MSGTFNSASFYPTAKLIQLTGAGASATVDGNQFVYGCCGATMASTLIPPGVHTVAVTGGWVVISGYSD